ncbi:MAG: dinitrogenase iron-molybdenum cofactor biosynthesis protein [Nitrospirae bacterium]|nr:MAG: dinitrogenase iron-molybdenum cofactor biosynthesis protein [Nitrospirota bacterium]
MKIAVSSKGKDLKSPVEDRFGRSMYFVIYDTDSNSYELLENRQDLNAPQGAGIQSASLIVKAGADVVITGHIGPKAFRVLKKAGVDVYLKNIGSISEAIEDFKSRKLKRLKEPDVKGHWM